MMGAGPAPSPPHLGGSAIGAGREDTGRRGLARRLLPPTRGRFAGLGGGAGGGGIVGGLLAGMDDGPAGEEGAGQAQQSRLQRAALQAGTQAGIARRQTLGRRRPAPRRPSLTPAPRPIASRGGPTIANGRHARCGRNGPQATRFPPPWRHRRCDPRRASPAARLDRAPSSAGAARRWRRRMTTRRRRRPSRGFGSMPARSCPPAARRCSRSCLTPMAGPRRRWHAWAIVAPAAKAAPARRLARRHARRPGRRRRQIRSRSRSRDSSASRASRPAAYRENEPGGPGPKSTAPGKAAMPPRKSQIRRGAGRRHPATRRNGPPGWPGRRKRRRCRRKRNRRRSAISRWGASGRECRSRARRMRR